jgi:hypothetical protein
MKSNLRELISLSNALLDLSKRQEEAIHRQAMAELEATLKRKDDLLERFGEILGRCSENGIALMDPRTFPPDSEIRSLLSLCATHIRRFRSRERYLLAQTTNLRDDISQRLLALRRRRTGIRGYAQARPKPHLWTTKG